MILHQEKLNLVKQLIEEGLTKKQVAQRSGIPEGSISSFMKFHGLKTKGITKKDSPRNIIKKTKYDHLKDQIKRELLKGRSLDDVAVSFNVPLGTMPYLVKAWGIARVQMEVRGGHLSEAGKKASSEKVKLSHQRGRKHHVAGLVILRGQYVKEEVFVSELKERLRLSPMTKELAEAMGCSVSTINRLLKKHNVQQGQRKGENSPHWSGGFKKYRGPDWYQNRKLALARDGFICQSCGKTNEQELATSNRGISVHHIIPYRVSKSSALDNLTSLCQPCHMKHEAECRRVYKE